MKSKNVTAAWAAGRKFAYTGSSRFCLTEAALQRIAYLEDKAHIQNLRTETNIILDALVSKIPLHGVVDIFCG